MQRFAVRLFALLSLVAAVRGQTPADDRLAMGKMWTFEQAPLAYLEHEYGFKPDQKWLDSMRLSALRLGERDNPWCSAAFVSPKGLVMTNHHCVREQIAAAQREHDWLGHGFAARSLEEEVPIPGLTVQQLVAMEDVTARLDEAIGPNDDADVVAQKRADNRARVQADANREHPGYLNQIVLLHQGAVAQLYRYKIYDDVRLVMAVDLQTAHFGGDPDNFTYPRWSADFAFVRAWERGAPADTQQNFFRWRQTGVAEGEPVFVPGNPGSTDRLLSVAQLECQRDVEYPILLDQLRNGIVLLQPYAERNDALRTTVLGWENTQKSIRGTLAGLQDETRMAQKRAHEQRLRAAIAADPALQAKYGDAWEQLDKLMQRRRALKAREAFHQPSYSALIDRATKLAKSVDPALGDVQRSSAMQEMFAMQTRGNALTRALTLDHFERAAKWLSPDDPYLHAVAGEQAHAAKVDWTKALTALEQSRLGDAKFVKTLADGGRKAVEESTDPAVIVGRALWPLMKLVELETAAVDGAIAVQDARIGRALHAVLGVDVSSDATMTLRFSDGRTQGYDYNGTRAPWATSLYGLFARHTEFGGVHPFDLDARWLAAKDKLDLAQKLCFAATTDIVGGNSGSCMVDRDLRVVGLVFDGNMESLPNGFFYAPGKARTVCVHTDAIVAALRAVFDANYVADELLGTGK